MIRTAVEISLININSSRYIIETAKNGKEALEKLAKSDKYVGIITDIEMPLMGGIDFIKELKNNGRQYPTIFISRNSNYRYEVGSIGLPKGSYTFLEKPFSTDELCKEAERLFR